MSQTYIFTVVVQGDDVQDAAEAMHELVMDALLAERSHRPGAKVHLTESVRVSE